MNLKKQYLFTKKLQSLYKSGKPIAESVLYLTQNEANRQLRNIFKKIYSEIKEGKMLYQAMLPYQDIFGDTYIRLITVGETSGKLDEVLERILNWQKKTIDINRKVISASVYPIILVLFYIFFLLMVFVGIFPAIADFMTRFNLSPPTFLAMTVNIRNALFQPVNCLVIPIGILLTVLIIYIWLNIEYLDTLRGKLILLIPGFGRLNKLNNLINYFFVLKMCYDAGLSTYESIELAVNNLNNAHIYNKFFKVTKYIENGENIFSVINKTGLVDFEILDLIRTGEESGTVDESYKTIIELLEERINTTLAIMIALIKPLGILFGILGIAMIFLGVFLAVSGIFSNLNHAFINK